MSTRIPVPNTTMFGIPDPRGPAPRAGLTMRIEPVRGIKTRWVADVELVTPRQIGIVLYVVILYLVGVVVGTVFFSLL